MDLGTFTSRTAFFIARRLLLVNNESLFHHLSLKKTQADSLTVWYSSSMCGAVKLTSKMLFFFLHS